MMTEFLQNETRWQFTAFLCWLFFLQYKFYASTIFIKKAKKVTLSLILRIEKKGKCVGGKYFQYKPAGLQTSRGNFFTGYCIIRQKDFKTKLLVLNLIMTYVDASLSTCTMLYNWVPNHVSSLKFYSLIF